MIDFRGNSDRLPIFVEAAQWLRPRLGFGVKVIGYDWLDEPEDELLCRRQEWSVADLDEGVRTATTKTKGLLMTRFSLEVYIDDPDDYVWFKLRFT